MNNLRGIFRVSSSIKNAGLSRVSSDGFGLYQQRGMVSATTSNLAPELKLNAGAATKPVSDTTAGREPAKPSPGTKIYIKKKFFPSGVDPGGLDGTPRYTSKIGLPTLRKLYTVLRSPHIDKKSREQFEMRINQELLVIKAKSSELSKKFFWLKRQRILGAQFEIIFSCKTRLPMVERQQSD